jgi:uncharacterized membrane-anchored protein
VKTNKLKQSNTRAEALRALKIAIVEGASHRYEELVAVALKAGATDEDIDLVSYEALHALLAGAERPITARQLAHDWHPGHYRS